MMAAAQVRSPPVGGLALPGRWPVWLDRATLLLPLAFALVAFAAAASAIVHEGNKPAEVVEEK